MRDLGMAIAHALPDHAHRGQHHLHGVRDDVPRAARGEAIHAHLRHAAAGALVQADREVELLRPPARTARSPGDGACDRCTGWGAGTPPRMPSCVRAKRISAIGGLDRLHREHGHAEEPIGIRTAVVGQPAVVGAAHRRGQSGLLHRAGEEADARIQERGVDAVQVHVGDTRVRVEAARPALDVLHGGLVGPPLPGADGADVAEALLATEHLTLDEQPLLAVGVDDQAGGPVAVGGVDVFRPRCRPVRARAHRRR